VEDISLHILDIAENSLQAGASRVEISIVRDRKKGLLRIEVTDDGKGLDPITLAKVRDPFFTTKGKKTGLGIPFLAQAAEQAGGVLIVDSAPCSGMRVAATFKWDHIDRPAIGSMTDTVMTLIVGHPEIDIIFEEQDGKRVFRLDTGEMKHELEDVPINAPEALMAIRALLRKQIKFEM
jgi:hypothetical protein